MREIIFRAWYEPCGMSEPFFLFNDSIKFKNDSLKIYKIYDNLKIMQYVGLEDKNGNQIYQGDLPGGIYESLKIDWCDECKSNQLISFYNLECFACNGNIQWYDFVSDEDKEIIGNVWEHPHLLEEEQS